MNESIDQRDPEAESRIALLKAVGDAVLRTLAAWDRKDRLVAGALAVDGELMALVRSTDDSRFIRLMDLEQLEAAGLHCEGRR